MVDAGEVILDTLIAEVKQRVTQEVDTGQEFIDEELMEIIEESISRECQQKMISIKNREIIRNTIFNSMKRFDVLQELIDDNSITEIMINGYQDIFVEKYGRLIRWDKQFDSKQRLEDIVQKIAAVSNKIVNESKPITDTRLYDGSRVSIVLPPIAINGPAVTIRKFYKNPITIEKLIEIKSITCEAAQFLECLVKARYNIFISGGTGSGKTTFLNALSNFIPKDERIITIEDSAELQLNRVDNLVRLEARNANMEGNNAVTIRDLIKSSLRMRPDRIIVGEVRGAEAIDMLQAMNTGHSGSLSTGHSNGATDMISRLETMVLMGMDMPVSAIRGQISSAVDIIVHLGRMRDKTRKVLQIAEVLDCRQGQIQLNPLYEFREDTYSSPENVSGALTRTENIFMNQEKLLSSGIWNCEEGKNG